MGRNHKYDEKNPFHPCNFCYPDDHKPGQMESRYTGVVPSRLPCGGAERSSTCTLCSKLPTLAIFLIVVPTSRTPWGSFTTCMVEQICCKHIFCDFST